MARAYLERGHKRAILPSHIQFSHVLRALRSPYFTECIVAFVGAI